MKIGFEIQGTEDVRRELARLAEAYPNATGKALFAEGLAIQAASVLLVPVDTGRLRASANTSQPKNESDGPEVRVSYGTDYALTVHERLNVHHVTGQAKYLEQPALAAMSGFAERMTARIQQLVGK